MLTEVMDFAPQSLRSIGPNRSSTDWHDDTFAAAPRKPVARELLIPVDYKIIERHERVLTTGRSVLPPDAIPFHERTSRGAMACDTPIGTGSYADRSDGSSRVGFRALSSLFHFKRWRIDPRDIRVLIVENKVNLLTLPPLSAHLPLWVGSALTDPRDVSWSGSRHLLTGSN